MIYVIIKQFHRNFINVNNLPTLALPIISISLLKLIFEIVFSQLKCYDYIILQ